MKRGTLYVLAAAAVVGIWWWSKPRGRATALAETAVPSGQPAYEGVAKDVREGLGLLERQDVIDRQTHTTPPPATRSLFSSTPLYSDKRW